MAQGSRARKTLPTLPVLVQTRRFCTLPSEAPDVSGLPSWWPPPPPTRRILHHHAPQHFPAHSSASYFRFEILHQSKRSRARVGRIHTPHGTVDTPGFVSVGTNAVLKHISTTQSRELNLQMMFANTYHLLLHPGPEVIQAAGGLHSFCGHKGTIITDSGGFQAFSMLSHEEKHGGQPLYSPKIHGDENNPLEDSKKKKKKVTVVDEERERRRANLIRKVNEEGIWFKSYRDGRLTSLTPESSVDCQKAFGADIIIPLDELPPPHCTDRERLMTSLHRTHRWEARSLLRHLQNPKQQAMYCVIHGGVDKEMRQESINFLTSLPFDGTAIGGNVGKDKKELLELLDWMTPQLHAVGRPIHLLGIGDMGSVGDCVPMGIDTFDSCYPTRVGRHGTIFTKEGHIQITKTKYKTVRTPLQEGCQCHTCKNYTTDYIHHLFKAHEPVGLMLGAIHNLHFTLNYFHELRERIWRDEI